MLVGLLVLVALQAVGLAWLVWRRLTDPAAPVDDTDPSDRAGQATRAH